MSEKITDYLMLTNYVKAFNHEYHTEGNHKLFNKLIPDGWDVINNTLIVIENKFNIKHLSDAQTQALNYINTIPINIEFEAIYIILGFGNKTSFEYLVYIPDWDDEEKNI